MMEAYGATSNIENFASSQIGWDDKKLGKLEKEYLKSTCSAHNME